MLEPERGQRPVVGDLERGRRGRGHEPGRRLEELQLETFGIGDHAEAAAGLRIARSRQLFADGGEVRRFGERAVMPHADRPAVRRADGDVADLPVERQVAKQHEVALAAAEVLLVQRRGEHSLVEAGGLGRVGDHDIEMLEPQVRRAAARVLGRARAG